MGGDGLQVDGIEIHDRSRVPEVTPDG